MTSFILDRGLIKNSEKKFHCDFISFFISDFTSDFISLFTSDFIFGFTVVFEGGYKKVFHRFDSTWASLVAFEPVFSTEKANRVKTLANSKLI